MLRDVRIRGAQELMTADMGDRLARVSETLASGDTLLAQLPILFRSPRAIIQNASTSSLVASGVMQSVSS